MRILKTPLSMAIALVLLGGGSHAAELATESGFTLEEVVVTARKVEENVQTTPIAVSAFGGEELELRGAMDLVDIGTMAPNVNIGTSASLSGSSSAPTVFIRGIGLAGFLTVDDPAVGIYLDGVYIARSVGGLMDLLDLERAEVLRGPQGTLFGRNTIGGAINLISKAPDENLDGKVSLIVGEDGHFETSAVVNVPITDAVVGRLSYLHRQRDGFVKALQYDDLDLGDDNVDAIRGQLKISPSEDLTFNLSADYTRERETPAPLVARNIGSLVGESDGPNSGGYGAIWNAGVGGACLTPAGRQTDPACFGNVHLPSDERASNSVWTDYLGNRINPENELDIFGFSATADWATDFGDLKYIVAYREMEAMMFNDLDFSPHNVFANNSDPFDTDQTSHELQFTGTAFNDRFNYVGGIYHFEENGDADASLILSAFNGRNPSIVSGRETNNSSFAVYGQGTLAISDSFHLTVGLRYTDEQKDFTASTDVFTPIGIIHTSASGTQETQQTDPLITLGWDIAEELYLYGSYSEGFRSGGFPARFLGGLPNPLPSYDPEYVKSYEAGVKTTVFDNQLRINAAVFYTDYQDLQVAATAPNAGFNTITTDNLASATLAGAELEAMWVLTEKLRLDLSLGYLDDDIEELEGGYLESAGFRITESNDLPFTPTWNGNLGLTYRHTIKSGGSLDARVDLRYSGEQQFRIENAAETGEDSYSVVNASMTYNSVDSDWSMKLGVRNLTNQDYATTASIGPETPGTFANISRPRSVYATFTYYLDQ